MFIKRTDLALEARELWQESAERTTRLMGGEGDQEQAGGIPSHPGGHPGPPGRGRPWASPRAAISPLTSPPSGSGRRTFFERAVRAVGTELKALLPVEGSALVVGLGNAAMTPDAVGPWHWTAC